MAKELTPLEAWEKLKNTDVRKPFEIQIYADIIETALKEYELMKQTKIIVADKKISDEDLEKLKNQRVFVGNLEQCEIKPLFDEETQKKLKALEIIKEYYKVNDNSHLEFKPQPIDKLDEFYENMKFVKEVLL